MTNRDPHFMTPRIRSLLMGWKFSDDRVPCTKFGGIVSTQKKINASIYMDPVTYAICASDLRVLHIGNSINKYRI